MELDGSQVGLTLHVEDIDALAFATNGKLLVSAIGRPTVPRQTGEQTFQDEDLIRFARGLPGFPDCTEFVVMEHDKETPLRWLHCVDCPEVAFLIVEPFADGFGVHAARL